MSERNDRRKFGIPFGNFSIDTNSIPQGPIKDQLEFAKGSIEDARSHISSIINLGSQALTNTVDLARQSLTSTADSATANANKALSLASGQIIKPLGKIAVGAQDIFNDLRLMIFDGKDEPQLGDRPKAKE